MAAGKQLDAEIKISGTVDKSLRSAIDKVSKQMDTLSEAAKQSSGSMGDLPDLIKKQGDAAKQSSGSMGDLPDLIKKQGDAAKQSSGSMGDLSDLIKKQGDALKLAQKQYASYVLSGEESSDEAKSLKKTIKELSKDLGENEAAMSKAEQAAQDLAGGAKSAKEGFTVMKAAAADLISNGIQKLIETCTEAVKSIYGLADETREFRQDMSTLETAFDNAGFSAETATDTWKGLYAVFGEDDRAVEAANNIARMAKNEQDLNDWVTITTGVWGTYQDALPVESLAEAAGETAKTGTVTGALADALNWSSEAAQMFSGYMSDDVTTAEDAFNAALADCTDEQERQALITDTLTALYGDADTTYEDTAGSIMEANEATAEQSLNMAELGERIEPVTTAVKEGINKILDKILELTGDTDLQGFADDLSGAFDDFVNDDLPKLVEGAQTVADVVGNKVLPVVTTVINWVSEHKEVIAGLAAIILGISAAVTVLNTAMQIQTAIMLASPVTWTVLGIVAAVAALIAIGILVMSKSFTRFFSRSLTLV